MMRIRSIDIDPAKLMTRQEVLDILREGGGTDRDLSEIRARYQTDFNNELMWRYPYSNGDNLGTLIVAVQEGFLSLPYYMVDCEDFEVFDLDGAGMLNPDDLEYLIGEYKTMAEDILAAMGDMLDILKQ